MKTQVLVVDDDLAVATVLGALLRQAGYDFVHAPHAEKALSVMSQQAIDLIIRVIWSPIRIIEWPIKTKC